MNTVRRWLSEIKRTGWTLVLTVLGALFISRSGEEILMQQFGVLAWKLLMVGVAVHVAHIVRKSLFPYLDLSAALEEKSQAGAITFLAAALIYTAVILALCAGL